LGNILAVKTGWHLRTLLKSAWHLWSSTVEGQRLIHKWLALLMACGIRGRMPQQPRVRAKQKVRQTRRLAQWRAKKAAQEAQNPEPRPQKPAS
jgi:hypothetical protein